MTIRDEIIEIMRQVAEEGNKDLVNPLTDETVLLQSGLDSLDFAIVVARLEERFEADPFSAMSEPVYPRTLSDLLGIYQSYFADKP